MACAILAIQKRFLICSTIDCKHFFIINNDSATDQYHRLHQVISTAELPYISIEVDIDDSATPTPRGPT